VIVTRESLPPIEFDGLRIYDYTAGQHVGASLAVIEVPPGISHGEAWSRRSDKYYLVMSGEIRFVLQGEAQMLGAGDFCLVRRGHHFSYANDGADPAILLLVHEPSFDLDEEVFVESR
jgi:mannose-6-phosphate isomerase-like protein (cupin superfamily)